MDTEVRYVVKLDSTERNSLEELISRGGRSASILSRARVRAGTDVQPPRRTLLLACLNGLALCRESAVRKMNDKCLMTKEFTMTNARISRPAPAREILSFGKLFGHSGLVIP